jgi:hypothetical protein
MLIRPDSRRLPTNQGEINARQSIAGTSLSWALSTSAELHTCVPELGSKTAPPCDFTILATLSSQFRLRQKKHRKCNFDLLDAVHAVEYSNVKRPVDPKTKRPLEPAHRFEVNIEGDTVSQAK